MLQLIGWLGCLYLAVKVLGMSANPAYRKEDGALKEEALAAVLLGWAGVILFAFAFLVQGNSMDPGLSTDAPERPSTGSDYLDCLGDPDTTLSECEALK